MNYFRGAKVKEKPKADSLSALSAMADLPLILAAARVLFEAGLQQELPNATVRRYVQMHPEINRALAGLAPQPVHP